MSASVALDNVPRHGRSGSEGHVESYFWRANDPFSRRAFWLKATILIPRSGQTPEATVWCCTFDGTQQRFWGHNLTIPLTEARFEGAPLEIEIGPCRFELNPETGASRGYLENHLGSCRWDLQWRPYEGPLGAPLRMFPFRWMLHTGFPRSKTVTPHPALRFNGQMEWSGSPIPIHDWSGMQGHNWGKEHTPRYAWGQCLFHENGQLRCMAEGFSGRIRVAGQLSPPISALVVRDRQQVYRFDRLLNLWNQEADINYPNWTLTMKGRDGIAQLTMRARISEIQCLGYRNPSGHLSYCLNSKLAQTTLSVQPKTGQAFELTSEFGGALEFLLPKNPGIEHVV